MPAAPNHHKPVRFSHRYWLLPVLLTAPLSGLAAEDQRQLPVYLSADRIEISQKKELSQYHGHVLLKQGTLRLTANHAAVQNRANLLDSVTAEGSPVTFRYLPEGTKDFIEGKSRRAVYYSLKRRVELYEDVQLQRGQDLFRSAVLHYDIETSRLVADGAPGQRVYAALLPQSQDPLLQKKMP